MKQCQECGTYAPDDAIFCYVCGKKFPNVLTNSHDKEIGNVRTEQKIIDTSHPEIMPLLERIVLFLEDEEFNRADEYCERVLDIDPKNAEAYIGKLLVELKCNSREQLKICKSPIENSKYYEKILRFGNEEQKAFIINATQSIRENNACSRKGESKKNKQEMEPIAKKQLLEPNFQTGGSEESEEYYIDVICPYCNTKLSYMNWQILEGRLICPICDTKLDQDEEWKKKIIKKERIDNNKLPIIREYDDTFEKSDLSIVAIEVSKNNPTAIFELARRYHFGYGEVEENPRKAVELYERLLLFQRNTFAMYQLGYLYAYSEEQLGTENRYKSIEYFEAAVELGDPESAVQLGLIYENGVLVDADFDKAMKLYQFALENGASKVISAMGSVYMKWKKWDKAAECFQEALDEDDLTAANPMGVLYENGWGVEQNEKKAYELYNLAYKDGDPEAPYLLGRLYYLGRGIEENETKAFSLFKKSIENDDKRANLYLGELYRRGIPDCIEKDLDLALEYLSKVESTQESTAEHIKGLIYLEQNNDKAIECFKKAANEGNENAEKMLELFNGKEIEEIENEKPDLVEGAIKGNEESCACLAVIYMGESSFGPKFYNFDKMKFWMDRCLSMCTLRGNFYYAKCLSNWAKVRRKHRVYDRDVLSDLQSSNRILTQLKKSKESNIDEINKIYYQNEWEKGWITCYSDVESIDNLLRAYSYFENVWNHWPCSDALHGMAVVSLHKSEMEQFVYYTAKALEFDKWSDDEMYANCLYNMGKGFLAQTNSKDNLENAYLHFSMSADLGYADAQNELLRFHRTFLGKLKYE